MRTAARAQPTAYRGSSSGGKHNSDHTNHIRKHFICRAYIAGLATSTIGGAHQRRGNHGQMATARAPSVCTHVQGQHAQNMPDLLHLSSAQPLATRMVSSTTAMWLLSRPTEGSHMSFLAGSGFPPAGSTALRGTGASETLRTAWIPQCHGWFGTIVAHANLNIAVLGRDVHWKTSFTSQRALPSYFMFSVVAHADTNFIPKVAVKQCYVLILLSQICPVVSHMHEIPSLQTSAAKPQTSTSAVSLLQNWMGLLLSSVWCVR